MIAKKWNFPEQLVEAIRFHHNPMDCREEYEDIVFSVYLANTMADLERDRITFEQIERSVLRDFGIQSEAQVQQITQRLSAAFEAQRARF
jgi:HD-like signal output (HDOD) protein